LSLGGKNLATMVAQTGRPARIDSGAERSGPLGDALRERGVTWSIGTPIMVEGRLWGLMAAGALADQRLLPGTEGRLEQFTELLATAIANADSRAALDASRARIVVAADEARRRIERDLHDRAQQRVISLGLEIRAAQAAAATHAGDLLGVLSGIAEGLMSVFEEIREISHGIHPAILSEQGLAPALRALSRRSPVPVELDLHADRRLPEQVEVAAYYVTSEALTNAVKHAQASRVRVELEACDTTVRLTIRDDGIGGADLSGGSGLLGLRDRIDALGGTLEVASPSGGGTTLNVEIPLGGSNPPGAVEP
jgi:signal transduction histidine kinase